MVLIVDDRNENIFSLKSLLELHKFNVDTAFSGEEALKKILKNNYALIILDVQMPGMDGYEVAESIKGSSRSRNIPIIFLSAVNIDKTFITKGYGAGAVDYITKPFDSDLLILKVKTFYSLSMQNRELLQAKQQLQDEIENRKKVQEEIEVLNEQLEVKVEERTQLLLESNHSLENSNAELQQYASLASHDLQEPLRKIITFSKMIQSKYGSQIDDSLGLFNKIVSSSERMRNLINDLLDYSKLSTVDEFLPCDLNKILQDCTTDLELSIQNSGAEILYDTLPTVDAIEGQMRQVFQNILSNAIKFCRKDVQPVIKIESRIITAGGVGELQGNRQFAEITVKDNGIGFDPKYLNKIFVMFQRLHGKQAYEGTGIGLAIVKKIIDKHQGSVTALSKEDEGSTFLIRLPLHQELVSTV
ncbi:MAG: response regulator [Ferruginibacter sp.]